MEITMDRFPGVISDRSLVAERWLFCFSIDGVSGYRLEMLINYKTEAAIIYPVCHEADSAGVRCPLCGLDTNLLAIPREEPIFQTYCLWALVNEIGWQEIGAACIRKTGLFFVTNRNIYLGHYKVTYNRKARDILLAPASEKDKQVAVNQL